MQTEARLTQDADRPSALWLAAVFVFAAALRLLYLAQIDTLPSMEFPVIDARSYEEWGARIAEGEWLGDRVFYQAPAYPYLIGTVYTVFGRSLGALHVVQMAIGALSCVLMAAASGRLFGKRAGICAGFILAAYAPALFFDGILQKTGLGLLLTSALIYALARFDDESSLRWSALTGAIVGVLALTRENALAFAVVIPVFIIWSAAASPISRRARLALAFAVGTLLVLLPIGLRNLHVGDTFAITTSQLGPNFYIGNNPTATGLYAPLLPGRHTPDFEGSDARKLAEWELKRELTAGEVSDYWLSRSLRWIAEEPVAWSRLTLQKVLLTLNDYEVPDSEDFYIYAASSSVLGTLTTLFRFGIFFPLAVAGLVLAASAEHRRRFAVKTVAAQAGVFLLATVAFYTWARYRFPLVPLLLPFAALALTEIPKQVRTGVARSTPWAIAAGMLAALIANLPLLDRERFELAGYTNFGNIMLREGKLDEADVYFAQARAIDPGDPDLAFHLGVLRLRQGKIAEAEDEARRMIASEPNDFRGHSLLSDVFAASGRDAEAKQHRLRALRLNPGWQRRGRPGAPPPTPLPSEEAAAESRGR